MMLLVKIKRDRKIIPQIVVSIDVYGYLYVEMITLNESVNLTTVFCESILTISINYWKLVKIITYLADL